MTEDFSKPYRGVAYFGLWATDTADDYGRREALTVLRGAVDSCIEDDMRNSREVIAALDYLRRLGHDKRANAFRAALDVQAPHARHRAMATALHALQDALGIAWGRTPDRF